MLVSLAIPLYIIYLPAERLTQDDDAGTTAPSPLPKPPCNKNAPYPVGTGTVCGCKKWYKVQTGDDCGPLAAKFGISTDQLYKWNPWLAYKDMQCMYLFPQSNVCVGMSENGEEL